MPEILSRRRRAARTNADAQMAPAGHRAMIGLSAVAAAIGTFLTIHPSGLVNDDFTNLRLVASAESLADTLFVPVFFTQVSPGHRLLTALQLAVGPLDRVVMHAVLAAMVAGSVVMGALIMRRLHGRRAWGPVLMALALAGPAAIRTNLWYSAAFHQTPSVLFGLSACWAYLRYRDAPHRRWWLGASVLLIAIGLTFSARVVIALLFIVLVEHVLLRDDDARSTIRGVWDRRGVWAWYLIPVLAYAYAAKRFGGAPPTGDLGVALESTVRGVVEVFTPMLLGLSTTGTQSRVQLLPGAIIVASVAALLAFVVLSVWRRRDAWRGLGVAAVVVVAGVLLSVAVRVPLFGLTASLAPRYYMEPLVYALPALTWAFAARPGPDAPPVIHRLSGRVGHALAAVVIGVLLVNTVLSVRAQADSFAGAASARWLEAVQASTSAHPGQVRSLNVPLHESVQDGFPRRRLDDVAFLFPNLVVTTSLPARVITDQGSVEPLDSEEIFRQSGAEYRDNGLVTASGDLRVEGSRLCTDTSGQLDLVMAPHPRPRWYAITMAGPAHLQVELVPRGGELGEPGAEATTTSTDRMAVLPMDLFGSAVQTKLTVSAVGEDTPACLSSVAFLAVHNRLPATPLKSGAGSPG